MMKESFGRLKKPLSFRAALLVVGCGGLPLQAADIGAGPHFSQTWAFAGLCSLILLLASAGAWRWARQWRARVVRERDEEVMRLMKEWTRNLEQEIGERKAAQLALQQSRELAMRQERLAHEFNNILAIIQGHASLLLDKPKLDEDSVKSITHITDGVQRAAALVKQMMAFTPPDNPAQSVPAALDDAACRETVLASTTLGSAR
ncbi:MAG: histidine kinase dimerization/phospho-acceptor domain-containing protein [Limisphaerales bacterium]